MTKFPLHCALILVYTVTIKLLQRLQYRREGCLYLPWLPSYLLQSMHKNSDLNIFALPVGQGGSIIIQCPAQYGGFVTLVDSGSCKSTNYMSAQNVSDALKGHTIENIFLSHPDKDHITMSMQ